ncbi:MAG: glycosyltransferase [Candidatus Omnitrophica bacterium]|nr:glycosyltransferase [Candidatus Omnitrophota bacterium]
MKIVNVIQRYYPAIGGSEEWCRQIARYISKSGQEVSVLTLNIIDEEEFWADRPIEKDNVKLGKIDFDGNILVNRYKVTKPGFITQKIYEILDKCLGVYFYGPHSVELYSNLRNEIKDADIVHLHTIPYPHNLIAFFVARYYKKPVVISPHFHPGHPHYERKINYFLLKRCDSVIVMSEYEKRYLCAKGVCEDRISVIGNGVELKEKQARKIDRSEVFKKYNIPQGSKVVTFLGRKLEYKGISHIVDAVRELRKEENKKIILCIAGPESPWYNGYFSGIPEKEKSFILDLGFIEESEKDELLSVTDILALPSKHEAFGRVFLDAWRYGIPVIGSKNSAMEEIIGDCGLSVEYGNTKDLKQKIKLLADNPDIAKEMGAKGRIKVNNEYGWQKIGSKVLSVYKGIILKKMKLLIVSDLFPPDCQGGAEVVAYNQAKALKKLGHNIVIFCGGINDRIGNYSLLRQRKGFIINRVNFHNAVANSGSKQKTEAVSRYFRRVLDDFKPHIVHFHNVNILGKQLIDIAGEYKAKSVMTLHDYKLICRKGILLDDDGKECIDINNRCNFRKGCTESKLGNFFKNIDLFISPSSYLACKFKERGLADSKIKILNNAVFNETGIKITKNDKANSKCINFGYLGYLGYHKGIELLISAFSDIKHKEKARLHIIGGTGDREYKRFLVSLSRSLKIDKFLKFYGRVPHSKVSGYYDKFDVLILPSIWPENAPMTILEAAKKQKIIIASDTGGIRELSEDIPMFLFSRGDQEHLRDLMEQLLADPSRFLNDRMLPLKKFNIFNHADKLLKNYEDIL